MWRELAAVCVYVCAALLQCLHAFCSAWEFMLPEWHHVCMRRVGSWIEYVYRGCWTCVWAGVVWRPWLVGDVGIRGRLERWLHNVFALMIPTVCSSYQLHCTGFHDWRWYEITHTLLPCTPPHQSLNSNHPTTPVRERSDLGRVGKQTLRERVKEREMDMYCRKFIDREGDSQGWPLESTEALARVLIVHWDNTLTPRRALGLQCNVPAEPQHITEGAVGGSSDKVSNVLSYTMWCECTFSGCWGEVWGYQCVCLCVCMCVYIFL